MNNWLAAMLMATSFMLPLNGQSSNSTDVLDFPDATSKQVQQESSTWVDELRKYKYPGSALTVAAALATWLGDKLWPAKIDKAVAKSSEALHGTESKQPPSLDELKKGIEQKLKTKLPKASGGAGSGSSSKEMELFVGSILDGIIDKIASRSTVVESLASGASGSTETQELPLINEDIDVEAVFQDYVERVLSEVNNILKERKDLSQQKIDGLINNIRSKAHELHLDDWFDIESIINGIKSRIDRMILVGSATSQQEPVKEQSSSSCADQQSTKEVELAKLQEYFIEKLSEMDAFEETSHKVQERHDFYVALHNSISADIHQIIRTLMRTGLSEDEQKIIVQGLDYLNKVVEFNQNTQQKIQLGQIIWFPDIEQEIVSEISADPAFHILTGQLAATSEVRGFSEFVQEVLKTHRIKLLNLVASGRPPKPIAPDVTQPKILSWSSEDPVEPSLPVSGMPLDVNGADNLGTSEHLVWQPTATGEKTISSEDLKSSLLDEQLLTQDLVQKITYMFQNVPARISINDYVKALYKILDLIIVALEAKDLEQFDAAPELYKAFYDTKLKLASNIITGFRNQMTLLAAEHNSAALGKAIEAISLLMENIIELYKKYYEIIHTLNEFGRLCESLISNAEGQDFSSLGTPDWPITGVVPVAVLQANNAPHEMLRIASTELINFLDHSNTVISEMTKWVDKISTRCDQPFMNSIYEQAVSPLFKKLLYVSKQLQTEIEKKKEASFALLQEKLKQIKVFSVQV
jgi:hypothetical protein